MKAFTTHRGAVAPLDRANVDTDQIIPKQFLKSIKRTGFGDNLFDGWRYTDEGDPSKTPNERSIDTGFVLNLPRYQGVSVLLARENFGCGSSREHAVWALAEYGFRAVIAPDFADIFHANCFKNGVLPIALPAEVVDELFELAETGDAALQLEIDLPAQCVRLPDGRSVGFEIDAFRKRMLVEGLDEIGLTLRDAPLIEAYEAQRRERAPWLFGPLGRPST